MLFRRTLQTTKEMHTDTNIYVYTYCVRILCQKSLKDDNCWKGNDDRDKAIEHFSFIIVNIIV